MQAASIVWLSNYLEEHFLHFAGLFVYVIYLLFPFFPLSSDVYIGETPFIFIFLFVFCHYSVSLPHRPYINFETQCYWSI